MRNVLIIGATSAIAQEVARAYAGMSASFTLLARNWERLDAVAADLRVRGAAKVHVEVADLADRTGHGERMSSLWTRFGPFDVALLAYGVLPDQKRCQADPSGTAEAIETNFTSAVSWLTLLAERFEQERRGTIAVITSVAGDRGRGSNYVYGSAKGGLTLFLEGLRNRLHKAGVAVVTIKPGFVDTPMTAHLRKGFLFTTPAKAGRAIFRAIERKRNVVYVPCFWRWILLVVRHLPEPIFKRLSL
jgi:short-subunit dehydrogenase